MKNGDFGILVIRYQGSYGNRQLIFFWNFDNIEQIALSKDYNTIMYLQYITIFICTKYIKQK